MAFPSSGTSWGSYVYLGGPGAGGVVGGWVITYWDVRTEKFEEVENTRSWRSSVATLDGKWLEDETDFSHL